LGKKGVKIVGKSALQGLSDYAGDVQAGVDPAVARKHAFRSTVGNIMEKAGSRLKGQGSCRKKKKKRTQKGGTTRKKTCCCLKHLMAGGGGGHQGRKQGQRKPVRWQRSRKGIKARTKYDLFSSIV